MTSKGSYTANLVLAAAVLISGYVIRQPLFPIRTETKRAWGYPRDSLLNFTELTAKYGYLSEEHTAVTEDGYLLRLFRIVREKQCDTIKQPPVLLMHGLLQSSDVWLDAGPRAGLAYLLADACYDLWVGNQRGNYYSRLHKHLSPEEPEFWQFSVDEIGYYDLPATIDYVLDYTGARHVNYIGFSQGCGSFYMMCSERPGYCDKARLVVSLAPASRQIHTKSKLYRVLLSSVERTSNILEKSGIQEVFSKGAFSQEFMAFFCQLPVISETVCERTLGYFDSVNPGSISKETSRGIFGHFPAGTSVKNMVRYSQSMRSDKFEKFDYGTAGNLKVYGSAHPPLYNLSAVTAPVLVVYGKNDHMVDPKDVEWLMKELPQVVEAEEVKDPLWNHFDVTYSQRTGQLIFPKINEYLLKYSDT